MDASATRTHSEDRVTSMSPQRVGGDDATAVLVTATKFERVYLGIERDCGGLAEIGFPNGGGIKKIILQRYKLKRKTTVFSLFFFSLYLCPNSRPNGK